jgi:hypothetical protein
VNAVATGAVALGVLLVWIAWRRSQLTDASRGAGVSVLGLTGGIAVLGGIAVGVSGLDTPPGVVAVAVSGVVLVAGSVVAATQVRRSRLSDDRGATSA